MAGLLKRVQDAGKVLLGNSLLTSLSMSDLAGGTGRAPDLHAQKKGLDDYWEMAYSDEQVASCLSTILTTALPGVCWTPSEDSDKGKRMARFVELVNDKAEGSTLEMYQAILLNALVTGFSVVEPIWMDVVLPEFGKARGLKGLYVRPSSSFEDVRPSGIRTNANGDITEFVQGPTYGGNKALPGEVFYFAYLGGPNNRKGSSLLRTIVQPVYAKREVYRLYPVFLTTNASGIRHAMIPDDEFKDPVKRENALTVMKRMASLPSIVTSKDWELKIDLPSGGVGEHFKSFIEMCNEGIRTGLLGDSAFSSQTGTQGARASREVSQENVRSHFAAVGKAFAEAITEQVNAMILEENGWEGSPIPITKPEAILSSDEAQFDALSSIAEMKTSGVITIDLPKPWKLQILQSRLSAVGIDTSNVEEEEPEEDTNALADGGLLGSGPGVSFRRVRAASSASETAALGALIQAHSTDLGNTWKKIELEILEQIASGLFESRDRGGWKVKDPTEARKVITEKIRYKSSEIRRALVAAMENAYEGGTEAAKALLSVKAAFNVGTTTKGWTPTMARQILNGRALVTIEDKYTSLASAIYYYIEGAFTGSVFPADAILKIQAILAESDFAPGRATTILETALSTSWNAARMNIFQEFEDADGTGVTDIIGYRFIAIRDGKTTPACIELENAYFRANDPSLPKPPLHYGCRSLLNPVYGSERDKVTFMDPEKSAIIVRTLRAEGYIQKGFGGF